MHERTKPTSAGITVEARASGKITVRRDVAEVILSISGSIFVLFYDSSGSLWLVGNVDTSKQELPPQPLWMLCGTQPI